ncbi:hypothetical protein J2736_001095 [Paenibacillus qinlingensis]|uniref:Uncharacterized protein n=1 Tax=Paenibacillus qinlingensis TaxID=1837343 RepID=A0ABU1NQZ9_9BACL|nr:hypothetical protein [Paenibacillus qinlingensis]
MNLVKVASVKQKVYIGMNVILRVVKLSVGG